MTINSSGWLDWAIRTPRTDNAPRTNPGINDCKGIFLHSAEGYHDHLLELATTGPLSWHFSNMMNGEFHQHYPITARCWHATKANNSYLGMENEGTYQLQPRLNEAQITNAIHCINEVSSLKGWTPSRPAGPLDMGYTLWEHNEVVRLGGSYSQCPSNRIPWPVIMKGLSMKNGLLEEGTFTILYKNDIPVMRWGSTDGNFPGRISKNFGGVWFWLRMGDLNSLTAPAYWSSEEGD